MKSVVVLCLVFAGLLSIFGIRSVPRGAPTGEVLGTIALNVAAYLFGVACLLSAVWAWTQ